MRVALALARFVHRDRMGPIGFFCPGDVDRRLIAGTRRFEECERH